MAAIVANDTHTCSKLNTKRVLCLFMCRTYFEIIVYKYFAIGCCKLCRIVRLLGPILLSSYSCAPAFLNSGHIHFFTILNFSRYFRLPFVSFVYCSMLFPLSIFLSSRLLLPAHMLTLSISQSLHVPSFSRAFAFFDIVCYNNTTEKLLCACDRYEQSLEPYDYKLSGAANH